MGVLRIDRGTLGSAEQTSDGGYVIPAYLTRTGVFDYEQPDGTMIHEYRPPEEVFSQDSLATLPNATLTNEHPDGHVHPDNFRKHVRGNVEAGSVKQDTDKISARLVVKDAKTISDIKAGRKREISCGYHCDVDETPGSLADGTKYDRIQRNIRYNHVALVADGRAGPEVRLRLDSRGNQTKGDSMEYEIIGGVKYEVGSEPHKAAITRRTDARDKRKSEAATLRKQLATVTARADAAEAKLKTAEAKLTEATSAVRLDHAVRVRSAVIRRAASVLGKTFKADGLSNFAIKVAAVRKAYPEVKLDKKSADYVHAMFRTIAPTGARRDSRGGVSGLRQDTDGHLSGVGLPPELREPPPSYNPPDGRSDGKGRTLAQIRADRDEDQRHRRPLAVSKSNPHKEQEGFPTVQGSMLETMR